MDSFRRPKLRVLALFGLVFLAQCCCCILPVRWRMEISPAQRAVQPLPAALRAGIPSFEGALRFAR